MMEDYLMNRKNLKQVFMLIDFRHKPSSDDIMMYNFLKYYKLPVTIVATKADKVGTPLHQKQRSIILNTLDLVVGDEFVVFLNDIPDKEIARRKARDIIRIFKVKKSTVIKGRTTVSVGLAFADNGTNDYKELFQSEIKEKTLYQISEDGDSVILKKV